MSHGILLAIIHHNHSDASVAVQTKCITVFRCFVIDQLNATETKQFTMMYSKIPILRPPLGLTDHFWTVPQVVTFDSDIICQK